MFWKVGEESDRARMWDEGIFIVGTRDLYLVARIE